MIGRDGVLAAVQELVVATRAGRGGALILQGAAGVGRTEVARAAAQLGRASRLPVAHIEAATLPPAPGAAMRHIARELGVVHRASHVDQAAAICDGLLHRARGSGLLLVIDDLQGLDEVDLATLRVLVQPRRGTGLALVATLGRRRQEGPSAVASMLVQDLLGRSNCTLATLQPWSLSEVEEFLHQTFRDAFSPSFASQAHELTGGNPSFLRRLADEWERLVPDERRHLFSGVPNLLLQPLPDALQHRVSLSLVGLPTPARETLEALAIWHRPASLDELVALTGSTSGEVATHLATLESWDLVASSHPQVFAPVRFRTQNRVVALAMVNSMFAVERQSLHRRAADLLERSDDELHLEDRLALARHYLGSADRLTHHRLEAVVQAARWSNLVSRYGTTRELLEHVVLAETSPRASRVLLDESRQLLAKAYAHLDAMDAAEQVLTSPQMAEADTEGRARLLRQLGRLQVAASRDAAAIDIYRAVISSEPPPSATLVDSVRVDLAAVHHAHGMIEEARAVVLQAIRSAEDRGDWEVAAKAHGRYATILVHSGRPAAAVSVQRVALQRARQAGSRPLRIRALTQAGAALVDDGRMHRAIQLLRFGYEDAIREGDLASAARTASDLALALVEVGNLQEAEDVAGSAVSLDVEMHRVRSESFSRAVLDFAQSINGSATPAAWTSETPPLDVPAATLVACAGFERSMGRGDELGALTALEPGEVRARTTRGWERYLYRHVLPRKARALAAYGEVGSLQVVVDELRATAAEREHRLLVPEYLLASGLLALTTEHPTRAVRALASARRIYTGFGHHFRAALAGRYEGVALREAGRTSASASRLADTYRRFAEMHVPSQLEAVRAELRLLGKRPPRPSRRGAGSHLTPREHQVAVLAGDGLTDAEIARRLWVSRRTVTTHMHNIFRKLGLESRAGLAAMTERTIAVDLPTR